MQEPIYLKITPDTYRTETKQLFLVKCCQYCSSTRLNYTRLTDQRSKYYKNLLKTDRRILWRTVCDKCNGTVAVALEPHKTKITS